MSGIWSARDPGMPDEPIFTIERLLAVLVGLANVVWTYSVSGGEYATYALVDVFFANLLIWFPDEMGKWSGWVGYPRFTRPTPALITRFVGWALLFLPAALTVFAWWYATHVGPG